MSKTHMGSSIDAFLKEEGIFEETQAQAIKEVVAWQLAEAMKQKNISKNKMATLLKTSRTQVDRLLDPKKRHHARQPATGRRNGRAPRERRGWCRGADELSERLLTSYHIHELSLSLPCGQTTKPTETF